MLLVRLFPIASVLMGPHIEKEHCFIQNLEGIVTLVPSLGAMCAIQGIEVTEPTKLSQGKKPFFCIEYACLQVVKGGWEMILEGYYYNEISKKVDNLQMMIHYKSG